MDRTKALGVGLTILLAWGLPVSGQELRSDEIEEVLVQAACTVDGADQATLRRIAASQREEGIAAIGRLLCQPDRFAHGEGNEAYRLLVDGLLHTAVNSFGVPSALRALREPLVGSEDERVAYVFESPTCRRQELDSGPGVPALPRTLGTRRCERLQPHGWKR